jgi:hypothetical protein
MEAKILEEKEEEVEEEEEEVEAVDDDNDDDEKDPRSGEEKRREAPMLPVPPTSLLAKSTMAVRPAKRTMRPMGDRGGDI